MTLNDEQITEVYALVFDSLEVPFNIDANTYAASQDILDILLDSLLSQEGYLDEIEFKPAYEAFNDLMYILYNSLKDRSFSEGDILKQLGLGNLYIFSKLMAVKEYFLEIEYFEGAANIKFIIDYLSDPKELQVK